MVPEWFLKEMKNLGIEVVFMEHFELDKKNHFNEEFGSIKNCKNTLCIVPCGNKKIWDKIPDAGPTKARDVYIGPFSKKCREYAEKCYPSSWCILSAKYGFMFPDEVISGPYNVSFNKKSTKPISLQVLSIQVMKKGLDKYDCIVILGGKNYVDIVKKVFYQKKVYAPLSNCRGIGYMMEKLDKAIQSGVPCGLVLVK